MTPTLTPKAAAHLEALIARAERRGVILEDLVEVCVTLSKKLARDMMDGPFHPESRHDTARAFDVATRSLRLTMAMEARVDAQLFALHNGELPAAPARRKEAGGTPAVQDGAVGRPSDREAPDVERRECDRESLVEREFEILRVSGDVDADIEAIRAAPNLPPPSPEVGRADSRLQGGSRAGGGRADGSLGQVSDGDNPEHPDFPPPGSGLKARVRPPHFGGGRDGEPPRPPDSG
jgi:hypothetical protein